MPSTILAVSDLKALAFSPIKHVHIDHIRVRRHESQWHSSFQLSRKRDDDGQRDGSPTRVVVTVCRTNKIWVLHPSASWLRMPLDFFSAILKRTSRCAKWPFGFENKCAALSRHSRHGQIEAVDRCVFDLVSFTSRLNGQSPITHNWDLCISEICVREMYYFFAYYNISMMFIRIYVFLSQLCINIIYKDHFSNIHLF